MLGFVDRGTKEVRIYYINNDRTKEKILPIVKKMFIHIKNKLVIILILMIFIQLREYILIVFQYIKNWTLID